MTLFCAIVAARLSLTNRDASGWAMAAVFATAFDLIATLPVMAIWGGCQ